MKKTKSKNISISEIKSLFKLSDKILKQAVYNFEKLLETHAPKLKVERAYFSSGFLQETEEDPRSVFVKFEIRNKDYSILSGKDASALFSAIQDSFSEDGIVKIKDNNLVCIICEQEYYF